MKNLNAYEADAVVDATASVHLTQLPFAEGERVRVFVVRDGEPASVRHSEQEIHESKIIRLGLMGTVLKSTCTRGRPCGLSKSYDN